MNRYKGMQKILAVIGLLFLAMAVWSNTAFNAGLGCLLLLTSGIMSLVSRRREIHDRDLRRRGRQLVTQVVKVEQDKRLSIGGTNPYVISSQWQDPSTGKIHVFESKYLWVHPRDVNEETTVTVYMSPDNPKDYFMDLSFLPKETPSGIRQEQKPTIRKAEHSTKFGLWAKLVWIGLVIGWYRSGVCVWNSYAKDPIGRWAFEFFVAFFFTGMIWTVYYLARLHGFVCPQCGTPIKKPMDTGNRENVPICFHCTKCDIIWDSGLRTESDI